MALKNPITRFFKERHNYLIVTTTVSFLFCAKHFSFCSIKPWKINRVRIECHLTDDRVTFMEQASTCQAHPKTVLMKFCFIKLNWQVIFAIYQRENLSRFHLSCHPGSKRTNEIKRNWFLFIFNPHFKTCLHTIKTNLA